jgi:iron(III) transport system ATP-binding protein
LKLRPAGFCLPGRVVSRRFLGEVDLVHIDVQGVDRPLQARVRDPVGVKEGLDVGIEIDTKDVLVFAASDA